jgi:putative membrane protein
MALCCGAAWAQDTGTQQAQREGVRLEGVQLGEAAEDRIGFTQQVAFLHQTQIALGKLALEKSRDPTVRAFAQKLVQEHQQHLQSLQTYAEANTLSLALVDLGMADMGVGGSGPVEGAAGVEQEERSMQYQDAYLKQVNAFTTLRSQLAQLQGRDFDKAFLEQVSNYQKQGQKLVNTGLSRFREDTAFSLLLERLVPVLQRNQSQAQSMVKATDQKQ